MLHRNFVIITPKVREKLRATVHTVMKEAIKDMAEDLATEGAKPPEPGMPIRTRVELAAVGRDLFGFGWKQGMADALGIKLRSVQRWASGEYSIPDDLHISLAEAAEKRSFYLEKRAKSLRGVAKE